MHDIDDGIEITAADLKRRLDQGDPVTLIDVREPWEWDLANLESHGARLMPLMTIPERLNEFDASRAYVLYCRSGSRSMRALQFMHAHGFQNVRNLQGGLHAWSNEVDPTFPQY
ncbi:MAG: rhodanese-like domain-containing protein [Longimicrobiales bacterium]